MTLFKPLPGRYLWPLLLLVGLCLGSILILLFVTTSAQDRLEAEREMRTLEAALDTNTEMVRHDLQDYAMWDDAVRNIARRFDPAWVDDNVTAYLGRTQGYSHVFVIDPAGRSIYAYDHGRLTRRDAVATLGPAFAASLARIRRMDTPAPAILSGYSKSEDDDHVHGYAVAAVLPLTGKVTLPSGGRYAIAIAHDVDPGFAYRIGVLHQLRGLTIATARTGREGRVAIRDLEGHVLARLELPAATPGTALRNQILPGLTIIILIAFGAALFVLRQGSLAMAALRLSEGRALHHANHDPLTALPNRRILLEHVETRLIAGQALSLVYMDLDGFKDVNDLYGHGAGDHLLRQVTARIAEVAGPDALIARMGGDEFAVLLSGADMARAPVLADHIVAAFQDTFAIAGANVRVGVSIGVVATTDQNALDVDELMRRADVAMYSAKARGKNRWTDYAPEMDEDHVLRKRLEHDLRAAIAANAIDVAYQPIVSAATGEIVCVEALARWTHPREGAIPPDIFIPLAEITGLIGALGEQVLAKACRALAPYDLDLSVNLSPAQFWDAHLAATIRRVLADANFPPDRLELEITENYLMRRPDAAAGIIEELRSLGIRLSLDDFGTGFASIGYLRRLRFDRLKIDKQFLHDATADASAAEMLVAIVALARALRLEITAEGVETVEQAALIRACGCHRMQGWLHGRPMPESALPDMIVGKHAATEGRL
jgi:diguanylate cyclase (GGDEF)-like protein